MRPFSWITCAFPVGRTLTATTRFFDVPALHRLPEGERVDDFTFHGLLVGAKRCGGQTDDLRSRKALKHGLPRWRYIVVALVDHDDVKEIGGEVRQPPVHSLGQLMNVGNHDAGPRYLGRCERRSQRCSRWSDPVARKRCCDVHAAHRPRGINATPAGVCRSHLGIHDGRASRLHGIALDSSCHTTSVVAGAVVRGRRWEPQRQCPTSRRRHR